MDHGNTRKPACTACTEWSTFWLWLLNRRSQRKVQHVLIIIINPLTERVVGAPQMILQPVFSIFRSFSTALWDLPNSRPVHSLMFSSHLFPCLPCMWMRWLATNTGSRSNLCCTQFQYYKDHLHYSPEQGLRSARLGSARLGSARAGAVMTRLWTRFEWEVWRYFIIVEDASSICYTSIPKT